MVAAGRLCSPVGCGCPTSRPRSRPQVGRLSDGLQSAATGRPHVETFGLGSSPVGARSGGVVAVGVVPEGPHLIGHRDARRVLPADGPAATVGADLGGLGPGGAVCKGSGLLESIMMGLLRGAHPRGRNLPLCRHQDHNHRSPALTNHHRCGGGRLPEAVPPFSGQWRGYSSRAFRARSEHAWSGAVVRWELFLGREGEAHFQLVQRLGFSRVPGWLGEHGKDSSLGRD